MAKRSANPELDQFVINLEYAFGLGVDLNARVIQLTEDVEEHHFDLFDSAMTTLEALNRKTITVKINSYGGDVYTALGIIGRMRESGCRIHTKGYGKIMSASTAILAAGDKRSMSKYAEFMHHECSYDLGGKHSEVTHEVAAIDAQEKKWARLMEELTGVTYHFWKECGVGKNFYADAEECRNLNIIEEIF